MKKKEALEAFAKIKDKVNECHFGLDEAMKFAATVVPADDLFGGLVNYNDNWVVTAKIWNRDRFNKYWVMAQTFGYGKEDSIYRFALYRFDKELDWSEEFEIDHLGKRRIQLRTDLDKLADDMIEELY